MERSAVVAPDSVQRPAFRLYSMAWAGLDWLFPPRCGGCERPYTRWCRSCQESIAPIGCSCCAICGRPLSTQGICPACRSVPPPFSALRSWAVYSGALRQAIHRLKYEGDMALGEILSLPMLKLLHGEGWKPDLITPVPMGLARRKERGYNQASMLAFPLALGSGIAYKPKSLYKAQETRSQVGLSAAQRKANVAHAYQARPHLVSGRTVLVVDDVATSGATLEACAGALLEAGACQVYCLTLARAAFNPDGSSIS